MQENSFFKLIKIAKDDNEIFVFLFHSKKQLKNK